MSVLCRVVCIIAMHEAFLPEWKLRLKFVMNTPYKMTKTVVLVSRKLI